MKKILFIVGAALVIAVIAIMTYTPPDDIPKLGVAINCIAPYELLPNGECKAPQPLVITPEAVGKEIPVPIRTDVKTGNGVVKETSTQLDNENVSIVFESKTNEESGAHIRNSKYLLVKGVWEVKAEEAVYLTQKYDSFIMEKNAKIVFPPINGPGAIGYHKNLVTIQSTRAEFRGNNWLTTQDKKWHHVDLPPNNNSAGKAGKDTKGKPGISGRDGQAGQYVISLVLDLGFPSDVENGSISNLHVDLSGMPGQNATNGSKGQDGGDQSCKSGKNVSGGPGGYRGRGGDGSSAGDFTLVWHQYSRQVSESTFEDAFNEWINDESKVVLAPGANGKNGVVGKSGTGGTIVRKKCVTNDIKKFFKTIFRQTICHCYSDGNYGTVETAENKLDVHPNHKPTKPNLLKKEGKL